MKKIQITREKQMSEAFILCGFLAFSGGFQDAYTYFFRHGVFANAQTGNVVLMSVNLMEGAFRDALHYFLPILAFAAGVLVADQIDERFKHAKRLHWRQIIVLLEIICLTLAGFIPDHRYTYANILISFSCALQVQGFRTMHGHIYASTMCIGNLRSGAQALSSSIRNQEKEKLYTALDYFAIILIFGIGAGLGGRITKAYGQHSIWVSSILLCVVYLLMEYDKYRKK